MVDTAAILGLGLIGGSLARDLARLGVRVSAYDREPAALAAARDAGVIDEALPADLRGIEEAQLVVLALPVGTAARVLQGARARLDAVELVVDVGSTKRGIVEAAQALGLGERFVGCHPLTGDHRSGWAAARPGLFRGSRVILTPTEATSARVLAQAQRLWEAVGARCSIQSAEEHDRELAWTSHLAQAVASSLALSLRERGLAASRLGPGGRDMTRLAGSSPEVWVQILRENADHVGEAVHAFASWLQRFREAMAVDDPAELERLLAAAKGWADEEP